MSMPGGLSSRDRRLFIGATGHSEAAVSQNSIPIAIYLLANDASHEVRAAAAAALGHLGASEASNELIKGAGDSSSEVRTCVAFALGAMTPSQEVKAALHKLTNDKDQEVRDWAKLSMEILHDKPTKKRRRPKPQSSSRE